MSCKLLALIIISNCPDIGRKVYYALLIMSTKPFLWQIFCLMKSRIPRRLLSSPCPCNWKILSSSSQFQIKSFLPLQLPLTIGIASRYLHIKASKTPIECEFESISDQQNNLSFFKEYSFQSTDVLIFMLLLQLFVYDLTDIGWERLGLAFRL